MKQLPFAILVICLLEALLFSCHKPEGISTQSTYTFNNTTNRRVTFDIYRTPEDYNQNANRIARYLIEPGDAQPITFNVLDTLWIDWYSADYTMTNWGSQFFYTSIRPSPPTTIMIAEEQDHYRISAYPDTSRSVLIGDNGISSTWKATVNNFGTVNGTHQFVFKKDFSCAYTYTDPFGAITSTAYNYGVVNHFYNGPIPQGFSVAIETKQLGTIFIFDCNTGPYKSPHTGRDTMLMTFMLPGSPNYSYPAVRQ